MPAKKKAKKPVKLEALADALRTWATLNAFVRTAAEDTCAALLALEQSGKQRRQFLQRIHSRLAKLRRLRERAALGK